MGHWWRARIVNNQSHSRPSGFTIFVGSPGGGVVAVATRRRSMLLSHFTRTWFTYASTRMLFLLALLLIVQLALRAENRPPDDNSTRLMRNLYEVFVAPFDLQTIALLTRNPS